MAQRGCAGIIEDGAASPAAAARPLPLLGTNVGEKPITKMISNSPGDKDDTIIFLPRFTCLPAS